MRRIVFRVWPSVTFLSTLLMIMAFQNCGQPGADNVVSGQAAETSSQPVTMTGTVQQSQVDGCQYLISVQDEQGHSQNYIPMDLDPNLLVAGNTISVLGTIRSDVETICMAGPVLQVDQAQLVK